jgi:phospholipid/cholesterol/gamma-HCH transport system substrate-binding protein
MRPFSERNPLTVGIIGVVTVLGIVVAAVQYHRLPWIHGDHRYSAYFADASGLLSGAPVQVSGLRVGEVTGIDLDESKVLVDFKIDSPIRLGDRTEAAVKTKSVLGAKILEITPRGEGQLSQTIPLERTTAAYQLPDALGDLATTVKHLDTDQLNASLQTLAETFRGTPPDLKVAIQGIARFSEKLNEPDEQLRTLLANANKATAVLGQRTDQVVTVITQADALLKQLRTQSAALDHIAANVSAFARQLSGLISENRTELKPAFDKLNQVLDLVNKHKQGLQKSLKLLDQYTLSLGESVASGPFFAGYIVNLFPGQFLQPFVDAAFSDLGLDPNVLLPSQLSDPQTGQPGTPALPGPYPRTGQGGEPRLTLPDAITGNPGDRPCSLPGTGCYPYREPPPAPAPGGPPPGPPLPPPSPAKTPESTVYQPAPNEIVSPPSAGPTHPTAAPQVGR